ncbi:myo-inositol-1(or 4)-monophosphatase [Candidatus Kryptonium thompsonii]|uniref:Inositol-1-monophosphatase n=1 Tax=Candidatus Kryptonium thompsonii TaxID=1633631 RepID=A0ABM9UV01_9BACT|nr:inositol monophosphatase family protein [Candidatus Kryptonium thompsoni]CUS84518.1 myo-inositol-1(or 4)-monophosphatase [Candidatus Kryptonium thompsoni]
MDYLSVAIEAAKEAGKFLKMNLGKVKNIERKREEINLVTEIDKGSEKKIIEFIKSKFPNHSILAEESGETSKTSEYKWIIDPLDGTTNYTHSFPVFCVSIALEYKGEVIIGVVYDPNLDELFYAEKGKGAFLNGKKISVSKTDKLIKSMLATGFPYNVKENPDNCVEHFVNFLMEAQAIRRLGSAALDLVYVACGRLDGFWEVDLNPWVVAAGKIIIEEAGGMITDFYGNKFSIYTKGVVASNGLIHQQMLEIIKKGLNKNERR